MAAVRRLAARLGLGDVEPVVLKIANHTTVRLSPLPLVARVRSFGDLEGSLAFMSRELAVAHHLAAAGAPAVRPSIDPEAGPYEENGCAISLWSHIDHRPGRGVSERFAAVAALREVHDALASYEGPLPSFERAISYCRELLGGPSGLSAAPAGVRGFLETQYRRAYEAIPWSSLRSVPLHGDTHLGNVLMTDHGPIWCDFEGVCLGPREWDLRSLKATSRSSFADVDPTLLARLRVLGRVMTTVWCWADADRSAEINEGAAYHLAVLRRRQRLRGGDA